MSWNGSCLEVANWGSQYPRQEGYEEHIAAASHSFEHGAVEGVWGTKGDGDRVWSTWQAATNSYLLILILIMTLAHKFMAVGSYDWTHTSDHSLCKKTVEYGFSKMFRSDIFLSRCFITFYFKAHLRLAAFTKAHPGFTLRICVDQYNLPTLSCESCEAPFS